MHFGKRAEFFEHMGRYTNNSKCSGLEKSLDEFERFHVRSCNPKALHFLVRPPWCFAYNKSEWALRYRPKHDRPNRGIAMLQPCPGAVSSGWMGVLVQGPVTESHVRQHVVEVPSLWLAMARHVRRRCREALGGYQGQLRGNPESGCCLQAQCRWECDV